MYRLMREGYIVDQKMRKYLTFLYYFSLLVGLGILLSNKSDKLTALCIYTLFAAAMILYHLICRNNPGKGKVLLYVFLIPALMVQYFDHTRFIGFSVWILIIFAMLFYGIKIRSPFISVSLLSHFALLAFQFRQATVSIELSDLRVMFVSRGVILLMVILAQKTIAVNTENKLLTDSLRQNAADLESALAQLSAYTEELKNAADLRARDKLMHELHDKLGHTLSTASIGAQAATILMDQDSASAKERMEMVTKQIQEAMKYLRQVISGKASDQNEPDLNLIQNLKKLITETEKLTGVTVKHNLDDLTDDDFEALSLPKRNFLYNALMEGLSNGVHHASPTMFEFVLKKTNSQVRLSLWNDGVSLHEITYGYGLLKMTAEAKQHGGKIEISNQDGFMLMIMMPSGNETEVS
jgi:signal transduction histidine kinase